MPNARFDRRCVSQIVLLKYSLVFRSEEESIFTYDEDDTAEITSDLEVALGHLVTEGNDDRASLASCHTISILSSIHRISSLTNRGG